MLIYLFEQSPVDAEEKLATAHGIMGSDEALIIAGQEHHVAVRNKHIGFLHLEGDGEVDEGEIADFNLVLEEKAARGGQVGVGVVFGEVAYGDNGLQGGSFVENGLRIGKLQFCHHQGQMDYVFVACFLQ